MKIVRITFLSCLAAVWIVACGQDTAEPPNTAEPPSPDPVDSWYNEDDIDNYHHSPIVLAVWKALGKNPFKATKAELAAVTRLSRMRRLGIISQGGIDLLAACVNLVELEIAFISVSNEQLAVLGGLTKLESLKLLGNSISDLSPLAGLVNLWHLELSSNEIEDLSPLAGLVNLQHLDLSYNQIEDLSPLVGLVQLGRLDLEHNKIVDIQPLLDNVGIEAGDSIDLQSNKLSDISRQQHVPALEARGVIVRQ